MSEENRWIWGANSPVVKLLWSRWWNSSLARVTVLHENHSDKD